MNLLPVRPQRAPGEHFYSLLERTAAANSISPRAFGLREATIRRETVAPVVLERLSRALAVPAPDLAAMTLDVYPGATIGRRHRPTATNRTWRLPGVRWTCPRCTQATGIYDRDWQFALHPLCIRCPALLQVHDDAAQPALPPPDDRAIAAQRRIACHLDVLRRSGRSQGTLRCLYELTSLIATASDGQWPPLAGWEHELRRETSSYTSWTHRPPTRPEQAAIVVLEAWRGIESPARGERLVAEGWDRIRAHPDREVRSLEDRWRGLLPMPPVIEKLTPDAIERPCRDTLSNLRAQMRHFARATGLQSRHIPGWILLPGERFAPTRAQWSLRVELAHIARRLLGAEADTRSSLPARRRGMSIARGIADDRGIRPSLAQSILDQARTLIDDGLIDYAERRRHLAKSALLVGRLRAAATVDADDKALQAWTWVTLTHGPAATPAQTDRAVEVDAQLDPEHRLKLHDAALDHLTELVGTGAIQPERIAAAPAARRESA